MGTMDEMGGMDHGVSAMEIRHVGEFLEVKVQGQEPRIRAQKVAEATGTAEALTPKSTIWKALGSLRLEGFTLSFCFRVECAVPLGFRAEGGYRPRSCRGWVGGTLYPSSAPAGVPAAPGRSASPCFAAESARVGTLMSLPEGIATLGSGEVRAEGRCRP